MARPKIRTSTRSRPIAKRASLPAAVATAVLDRLFTATGSGRDDVIVTNRAKRRPGTLSHPKARGKSATRRPGLAAAVASAVTSRLSAPPPVRKAPVRKAPVRAPARKAKPRSGLVAAVASAVSQQLAGRAATRRR